MAVLVLTLALFLPVLGFDFLMFDDDINIYNNPHLGELTWARVGWMVASGDYVPRFMPLGWLQFNLIFGAAGLSAWAYHAGPWLLHGLNAVLVYLLLVRSLRLLHSAPAGIFRSEHWAVVGAGLWAAHPLRGEPVAWASGLLYVHATFWALLAVWWVGARRGSCAPFADWRLWLAWGCYGMSVFIYPVALGVPGALVVFETWLNRRAGRPNRPLLAVYGPFFALALGVLAANASSRVGAAGLFQPVTAFAEFGWGDRLLQAVTVAVYYVGRPFVAGQPTAVPNAPALDPWFLPLGAACALLAVGWTIVGWRWRKRFPAFGVWSLGYVLVCLPFYGLLEANFLPSDRYLYLPSVMWVMGLVTVFGSAPTSLQRTLLPGCALWVGWLGTQARTGLESWRTSESHFASIAAGQRDQALAALYGGQAAVHHARRGEYARAANLLAEQEAAGASPAALAQLRESIREVRAQAQIATTFPLPSGGPAPDAVHLYLLARAAARQGERKPAEVRFRAAIDLEPALYDARHDYAVWLATHGRVAEARMQYELLTPFAGRPATDAALARLEGLIASGGGAP